jgi:hypothetical protein
MPQIAWRMGDSVKCEALWIEASLIEDTTTKHLPDYRLGNASGDVHAVIEQSLRQKEIKLRSRPR